MNFFTLIIIGYIVIASIVILILVRDLFFSETEMTKNPASQSRRKKYYFKKWISWTFIIVLGLGIVMAIDARFIEPYLLVINTKSIKISNLKNPIKIILVTDIQVSEFKKQDWVEKIVKKIEAVNPDLVLLGGDQIDNEGTNLDESQYLEPLRELVGKYPIYYILGNHEYGIGGAARYTTSLQTGDKSDWLKTEMAEIGIPLLQNQLVCPEVKKEKICIFGADEIWKKPINFSDLKKWNPNDPLLFLVHNPDGAMYWPDNFLKPNLVLAGHTHGGQIRLPFVGPLGSAPTDLPKNFYKGLNYYHSIPVFTSVGAGESGGPIRFLDPPEISVIELVP
ncbi:MAG: metallophosphoesterase [Patescibacteria group bacterium]